MDTALISAPVYAFGLILTVLATNWIARKRHERHERHERHVMRMLRRLSDADIASRKPLAQQEVDRVLQRLAEIS